MATNPVCPCDANAEPTIANLPGLPQISYRAGDFNSFRRALLTPLQAPEGEPPLEQALTAWQSGVGTEPGASDTGEIVPDLAVMMVEWWAYLADILTFYNERIANEDYLRTAVQADTPGALVRLLGYRPRPAIGATGTLAGLVTPSVLPGQKVNLPEGLQFQSKPSPGQPPQTYELHPAAILQVPDRVAATTIPQLVATLSGGSYGMLLLGSAPTLSNGTPLLLDASDDTQAPTLIILTAAPQTMTATNGGKQTLLTFTAAPPGGLSAERARLRKANQSAALWTVNGTAVSGTTIQLASLARQIKPGDWVVFTTGPTGASQVVQVSQVTDKLGDASSNTGAGPTSVSAPTGPPPPIPVLHTQLTLASGLNSDLNATSTPQGVTVLFGWVDAGVLVDQPASSWNGSGNLQAVQPAQFAAGGSTPIMIQDAVGAGVAASANVNSDQSLTVNLPTATPAPLSPALQPPLQVYYNLLPVSQGKTVANEIVGSGDGTVAGQSFTLAKSPVTYLMSGSTYASTIALTVNGQPWTEVPSFYGQPANATIFTTREDATQTTHLDFGDGVNGARLPTGTNNVVATYRVGAGAASPPAGKLTVISQSYPGLQSVVNPVAVSGGSDPDPAALLKQLAPRSVLAFGRAVSVFDYEAIAAGAPGVTQASAVWNWDEASQYAGVTVYVTGESGVQTSVQTLLSASGDPNRPVQALAATDVQIELTLGLVVTAGMDQGTIQTAVTTALCDPNTGMFAPAITGIDQGVFNSMIETVCLGVSGVVATKGLTFSIDGVTDGETVHWPGEGCFFSLAASDFHPTLEVGNGQ
jgi:hypothetical protein